MSHYVCQLPNRRWFPRGKLGKGWERKFSRRLLFILGSIAALFTPYLIFRKYEARLAFSSHAAPNISETDPNFPYSQGPPKILPDTFTENRSVGSSPIGTVSSRVSHRHLSFDHLILHDVAINATEIHFYGIKENGVAEGELDEESLFEILDERLVPYVHFLNNETVSSPPWTVVVHREYLNWSSQCTSHVSSPAVLHSLWHPDNLFHLHNNNLLPLFLHLRELHSLPMVSALVSSTTGKRVKNGILDIAAAAKSSLLLYSGDPERNARSVGLTKILSSLFPHWFQIDVQSGLSEFTCFSKLSYGQDRPPFYIYSRDIRGYENYHATCREFRNKHAPSVLFMDRPRHPREGRYFTSLSPLVKALRREGIPAPKVIGRKLAGVDVKSMLKLMVKTDILIGFHGSGLTNLLYMAPGGVVGEFQDLNAQQEVRNTEFLLAAELAGLRHVAQHVTPSMWKKAGGYAVSPGWAKVFAQRIRSAWDGCSAGREGWS